MASNSRGEHVQEEPFSSDSEFEDDDDATDSSSDVDAKLEEDDVFDVEFFKCYSALKKKDQKIYDEKVKFFTERDEESDQGKEASSDEAPEKTDSKPTRKKSSAPRMTLLDHQLNLKEDEIEEPELERPAKIDLDQPVSKSFYDQELEEIKKKIEKVNEDIDGESDDDLLVLKGSNEQEAKTKKSKKELNSILDKIEGVEDEDISHLKQVWSDPKSLPAEERFLRDYILNKRYLASNAEDDDDEEEEDDQEDESSGFFSKNLDNLPDIEKEKKKSVKETVPAHHSDEQDFDKIVRIPRNSTKTIRDLVEKQEKKEKRLKKIEKEKKKKKILKDADFEDIVGDMPTKFHYRETEPIDYGLSAEELLMATDEELDKWVSLHEAIAYKTREEELAQKRKFEQKRHDLELKKKIFKSIYGKPDEVVDESPSKKKRGNKRKRGKTGESSASVDDTPQDTSSEQFQEESNRSKKKKKKRRGLNHKKITRTGVAPDRLLAYGLSKSKLKKSKLL